MSTIKESPLGNVHRPHGGLRSRFTGTSHHGSKIAASLRASHPALIEGHTLFPSRVVSAEAVPRVLVSGFNNAKIGKMIEKGPWSGFPIFTLTLEERATCPRTCENWATCFGNAMPMPRRHKADEDLIHCLDEELRWHAREWPEGFAVRLHVLGDFYSLEYVGHWMRWMREIPQLHVWGYTARLPATDIGDLISCLNDIWPNRWVVRASVASDVPIEPLQVTTIWRQPETTRQPEGAVCPQQFDKTACCGTCGLCWAPEVAGQRIVFVGHGMNNGRRKKKL